MTSEHITFDANNLDEFTTKNGVPHATMTTATPGLAGTAAKCALEHDPSPPHYGELAVGTGLTGTVFRLGAYLQSTSITWSGYGFFLTCQLQDSGSYIMQLGISNDGAGGFRVISFLAYGGGSSTFIEGTTSFAFGDLITIEGRIVRGTGTAGEFHLYANGVLEASLTGIDNSAEFDSVLAVCNIKVFPQQQLSSGAGTVYIDEVKFNNTDTVIYPSDDAWDSAAMAKPCAIDADGQYIYISALNAAGFPVLIQFSTALDADGSLVFDPGSGSDIGVECSPTNPDVIWIAGAFDSTNTVERSTNGAASFVVEDPGTFAPVTAFDVGPDTDERVLVATETSGSIGLVNILETVDGGDNWTEHNAGLSTPASILAMDRYPANPEELVFGNANAAADRSDYTPNSGYDLDDITSGLPTFDATGVIVG